MQKSTIVESLKSFTKEDLIKFDEFVRSPYFNKNSTVIKFITVINKYGPGYDSEMIAKEKLWTELFPEKEYNYGVMKNLIYDLKKLIMKFMAVEEFEESKMEKEKTIVRALLKRNLPKSFKIKVSEIERTYEKRSLEGENIDFAEFYYVMFNIYWMKHSFYRVYDPKKANESDMLNYTAMTIYSFLLNIFLFHSNIFAEVSSNNYDPEKDILFSFFEKIKKDIVPETIDSVREFSEKDHEILDLLWMRQKIIMSDAKAEDFFEYREKLYENINRFGNFELTGMLYGLGNSAVKLNSPLINIHSTKNELMKILIRKKLFLEPNGSVKAFIFQNAVMSAGEINDFDMINMLLKKFVKKVYDDKINNSENFCEIYLNMRNGKFNEALELISRTELVSFVMKVHLRLLKARCLYELNDPESFAYERDSFNHFLKSNKSLNEIKKAILKDKFNKISSLFRLRKQFSAKDFNKLKKEIMSDENYSAWMKDKIAELEEAALVKKI